MRRYRLKAGTHQDLAGRDYVAGDVLESAVDLRALFPNKFELVDEGAPPTPPTTQISEGAVAKAGTLETALLGPRESAPVEPSNTETAPETSQPAKRRESKPSALETPQNVTKEFPIAMENDLVVVRSPDGAFSIGDIDQPDRPLTVKPLKTAKQVEQWIRKYIREN